MRKKTADRFTKLFFFVIGANTPDWVNVNEK